MTQPIESFEITLYADNLELYGLQSLDFRRLLGFKDCLRTYLNLKSPQDSTSYQGALRFWECPVTEAIARLYFPYNSESDDITINFTYKPNWDLFKKSDFVANGENLILSPDFNDSRAIQIYSAFKEMEKDV